MRDGDNAVYVIHSITALMNVMKADLDSDLPCQENAAEAVGRLQPADQRGPSRLPPRLKSQARQKYHDV